MPSSPYYSGSSRGGGSPYYSGTGYVSPRVGSGAGYVSPRVPVRGSGKPKKKGRSGIGGFVGNLWEDIEGSLVGLGPATVGLGKALYADVKSDLFSTELKYRPLSESETYRKVLRPIGQSYAYSYGPLVRGDLGEFRHRLYEHPLGPILDVTAILSGGATAAAKTGLAPAALKRGFIELETPAGKIVRRPLAKQTLRAELQAGRSAALNLLPPGTRVVGEYARAARVAKKAPLRFAGARELVQEPYLRSLAKLRNPKERVAAFWLSQVPLSEDLGKLIAQLEQEGSQSARATVAILRDPKVVNAYSQPSARMLRVLSEAAPIAEAQRVLLGITEEVARQRAYMPTLIARGAKIEEKLVPPPGTSLDDFIASIEKDLDELGVEYPQRLGVRQSLISARGGKTKVVYEPAPGYGTVEDMIAKIDADLVAAGRPRPIYMPHTSQAPKLEDIYGVGGKGPPTRPGPLHQTMGILLGRGQLIADPQVLSQSFRSSVKRALYADVHRLHLEHARKLPPGEVIPAGWQVVRRSHAERTPYTVKTGAEFEDFARDFLDKEGGFTFRDNPFTTRGADALVDEQGFRYIVPKEFSRQLTGEFVRAGSFIHFLNRYPVRVWRHLVLKLRPAWLVNNVLGNTLLYLVHSSDPVALQELAGAFRQAFPHKATAFDRILREHFPETISGTFIGSQLPVFPRGSRLARIERPASIVGAGLAQVDRAWEQALRSAIVRTELRRAPELRAFSGKMRGQTNEFWRLADKELATNPLLAERISERVSDALGDFLALGRFERDVVRAAFPFYAWFRVITLITVKLPLTHPLKAPLLSRVGQAGTVSVLEELGLSDVDAMNYAKGFFPFGPEEGGRVLGLATTSLNPFATVAELQEFVEALAFGSRGEAWRKLPGANPFLGLPLESLTGAEGRSGYRYEGPDIFGLVGIAATLGKGLPQARLGEAATGTIYRGTAGKPTLVERDWRSELARYFGIPYARISPRRVQEIAEQGR